MTTQFAKEEMIQAKQFRSLSQKAIQQMLKSHKKIGVFFPQQGLDAVMLSHERYEAMVQRLEELENTLEDIELEKTYGYRLNTPAEKWIEHTEGMSTLEMYRQQQSRS